MGETWKRAALAVLLLPKHVQRGVDLCQIKTPDFHPLCPDFPEFGGSQSSTLCLQFSCRAFWGKKKRSQLAFKTISAFHSLCINLIQECLRPCFFSTYLLTSSYAQGEGLLQPLGQPALKLFWPLEECHSALILLSGLHCCCLSSNCESTCCKREMLRELGLRCLAWRRDGLGRSYPRVSIPDERNKGHRLLSDAQ